MLSALELSKYVINRCIDMDYRITVHNLQKILYMILIESMKKGRTPFVGKIIAKGCGARFLVPFETWKQMGLFGFVSKIKDAPALENAEEINAIIDAYYKLPEWKQCAYGMHTGGAWDMTYQRGDGDGKEITRDLIEAVEIW